jgi:hypothetical protein
MHEDDRKVLLFHQILRHGAQEEATDARPSACTDDDNIRPDALGLLGDALGDVDPLDHLVVRADPSLKGLARGGEPVPEPLGS